MSCKVKFSTSFWWFLPDPIAKSVIMHSSQCVLDGAPSSWRGVNIVKISKLHYQPKGVIHLRETETGNSRPIAAHNPLKPVSDSREWIML